MAIVKENHCVDCGRPCLGAACPNQNVIIKYCDICSDEVNTLYRYENTEYCKECLIESLLMDGVVKEVEYSEAY
jgi:hypothetical protein